MKQLGRTGVRVSPLALGTMAFGADRSEDAAMFAAARDAGINVFDCANVYRGGESERSLGQLVKSCRDQVLLTTKAYFPAGSGPNDRGSSRLHLVRAVEASLKRLDTDRIELFFLHRFDPDTDPEQTLRALDTLVQQGKLVYLGLSNFAAWQAQQHLGVAALHGLAPPVALQPMYNLAKRQAESEILPMAQANDLAVFPYGPLGGGLLSGKYTRNKAPSGRLVDNPMYATRYADPDLYRLAEDFTELAKREGLHPVTLAVAWVAQHPAITAPLLGPRTAAQLVPALAAAELTLSERLYDEVGALSRAPAPATDRNEEATAANYSAKLTK